MATWFIPPRGPQKFTCLYQHPLQFFLYISYNTISLTTHLQQWRTDAKSRAPGSSSPSPAPQIIRSKILTLNLVVLLLTLPRKTLQETLLLIIFSAMAASCLTLSPVICNGLLLITSMSVYPVPRVERAVLVAKIRSCLPEVIALTAGAVAAAAPKRAPATIWKGDWCITITKTLHTKRRKEVESSLLSCTGLRRSGSISHRRWNARLRRGKRPAWLCWKMG